MSLHKEHKDGLLKVFENIQNSGSQLHKDFIFKKEHIVIFMTTVLNDEVVVPLQNENTVIPLQGTDTAHPEVDLLMR